MNKDLIIYLPSNMYANANAAMNFAILDADAEQSWTSAGTPPSSTIRRAFPGLKARFHRAPAAVSWTSWKPAQIMFQILKDSLYWCAKLSKLKMQILDACLS